jgi:hypothetical protein
LLLLDGVETPEREEDVDLISYCCRARTSCEYRRQLVKIATEGDDAQFLVFCHNFVGYVSQCD